jgi:hypothetical protein
MRLKVLLKGTTEAIDLNLASFEPQFVALRKLGTSLFPAAHFINVEFKEAPSKT